MVSYGYLGIVVMLVLTGCGLPVPEEVFIIAAGIAAYAGKLNVMLAAAACMTGALLGDMAMYGIGRYFGRGLLNRGGFFSHLLSKENEAKAEKMICNHGLKAFFVARFLVGIRAPMYVAAGIMRVPFARFLVIDAICATAVVGTVFTLSYVWGNKFLAAWEWIHQSQVTLTITLTCLAGLAAAMFWWHRHRVKKAAAEAGVKEESGPAPVREEEPQSVRG